MDDPFMERFCVDDVRSQLAATGSGLVAAADVRQPPIT
jgi:hypothetical protein